MTATNPAQHRITTAAELDLTLDLVETRQGNSGPRGYPNAQMKLLLDGQSKVSWWRRLLRRLTRC